jgi:hypothetical protein
MRNLRASFWEFTPSCQLEYFASVAVKGGFEEEIQPGYVGHRSGTAQQIRRILHLKTLRDEELAMIASDFRRIALSLDGAEEGSHMGQVDFRVGGHIFATLASEKQGFGNLMLTPEQQAAFVAEQPNLFVPIAGGWGKNGATHIRLAEASEDLLVGALRTAWLLRIEKNQKSRSKPKGSARQRNGSANHPSDNRNSQDTKGRVARPFD